MLRRIFTGLTAGAVSILLGFILTGCGKGQAEPATAQEMRGSNGVELTLATIYSTNYESIVNRFNESNNNGIKIKVEDYAYNCSRDAAINRLNMELAAGKGPDLIDFEAFPRREIYARQGLLLNLSAYFERDLNADDYFLIDTLAESGLYFIPSGFNIMSCYIPASVLPGENGLSYEEYRARISSRQLTSYTENQSAFLQNACISLIPSCVDWEKMNCNFDCREFKELLELSKFIGEAEASASDPPAQEAQIPCSEALIRYPTDIRDIEKAAGGSVNFVGYPTVDGRGSSYAYLSTLTGITTDTPYREESWEFIKYMLSDNELQEYISLLMIPMKKSVCQETVDECLHPFAKYEGHEITLNDDGSFSVDGVYMDQEYDPAPKISDEQAVKYNKLIEAADTLYDYDPGIYSIIEKEAQKYFSGSCQLEAATHEVQSRVSIYLAEQYG